jgi:chromosome segregation ATPase
MFTNEQLQSYANSQSPLHGELAEVARELIRKSEEIAILRKALEALQRRTARHDHAKDLGQAVDGDAAIMSRLTLERDDAKAALAETAAQRDAAVATVRSLLESYDILMNESPISRSQVAVGVVQGAFIGTVVDARKLLASLVEAPDPNATQ